MDFLNFGASQLNNGSLNNMLEQVGIDDVGSFVNQFRNKAGAPSQVDDRKKTRFIFESFEFLFSLSEVGIIQVI
jgi:hypothetical protein